MKVANLADEVIGQCTGLIHLPPVGRTNRFSATLQDCVKTDPKMALSVGSHVHIYGIKGYGSLYSHTLEEIF